MNEKARGILAVMYIFIFKPLGALLPIFVVFEHFIGGWLFWLVFFVYYYLSGIFLVAFGYIQLILTIIGAYFAFVEYPFSFFVVYMLVCVPVIIRFFITLFGGNIGCS